MLSVQLQKKFLSLAFVFPPPRLNLSGMLFGSAQYSQSVLICQYMLFQNLSTTELENLLIEETKKYTSSLRSSGLNDEKEQIRLRIEVLIKALYERKESNARINEIIKMIDEKMGQRSPQSQNRNPAG